MRLAARTRLGPYEIVEPIGAGGMGEVYRARDARLGRDVAIKILPDAVAGDPERLNRFRQEAQAASALNHPNILTVYDASGESETPYVVTELLEGETLRSALERGAVPPRKAIDYAVQIARGLAAAHERGIIHRDIKPENLFITHDGHVKILDFGLAKVIGQREGQVNATMTSPGTVLGTTGYMSPEQVRGTPVEARSDIFSLGAVLYEMLSGRRAFDGASAGDVMSAVLKDDPPEIANVSPALERIVRHCLEKAPRHRFESARDLGFALETLSGSAQTAASGLPPPRAPKRLRWLPVAIAIVGALAALAAAFYAGTRAAPESSASYRRLTFRRGMVNSARFTPEGSAVVFSAAWDGKPLELYTVRLDNPESRSLGITGSDVESISAEGEMALIARRPGPTEFMPGVLSRAPVSGGSQRQVLDDIRYAQWTPGGQLAIVRDTGEKVRLEFPPGTVLYETRRDIGQMRAAPDGGRFVLAERSPGMGGTWDLFTIDRDRNRRELADGLGGEDIHCQWSGPQTVLFDMGTIGGNVIHSVSLKGARTVVERLPVTVRILDVFKDGRILLSRQLWGAGTAGVPPGETKERDLSWLDATEVDDISQDGRTLLLTEYGEGGGLDRWSVYLRKSDGSDPVRLGEGQALALSRDGRKVLGIRRVKPELIILHTGPGEPATVPNRGFMDYLAGAWMPDEKKIIVSGSHGTEASRLWILDVETGMARAVTPQRVRFGLGAHPLSPDGKRVVGGPAGGPLRIYEIERKDAETQQGTAIPGTLPNDRVMRWSADGQSVFILRPREARATIMRVNLRTGVAKIWKEIVPSDPAGVAEIYAAQVSADEKAYYYSYQSRLGDLYVMERR